MQSDKTKECRNERDQSKNAPEQKKKKSIQFKGIQVSKQWTIGIIAQKWKSSWTHTIAGEPVKQVYRLGHFTRVQERAQEKWSIGEQKQKEVKNRIKRFFMFQSTAWATSEASPESLVLGMPKLKYPNFFRNVGRIFFTRASFIITVQYCILS